MLRDIPLKTWGDYMVILAAWKTGSTPKNPGETGPFLIIGEWVEAPKGQSLASLHIPLPFPALDPGFPS